MGYSNEQRDIIEKCDGSVVVSAGAGAGKTLTLVEKIQYDIEKYSNNTHKIVAAITFTIKATNEIKTRLRIVDGAEIYVSTNNQFVIKEIIEPFCKDCYGSDYDADFDVNYEQKIPSYDLCLDELKRNKTICSISNDKQNFVFQLALKILKNSEIARKYLSSKYYKWYIDEYQDTDNDMHAFFMYVHSNLKIDLFIVGDEKQNIYSWRGANSHNFSELFRNPKFIYRRLTENFRSCQQIQNLSNLLNVETQSLIKEVDSQTQNVAIYSSNYGNYIDRIIEILILNKMHAAVLCKTNEEARMTCNALNNKGSHFVYVPATPIDDITCTNSWIYFGVAHYCLVNRNVYDFIEYVPFEISVKSDQLSTQVDSLLYKINNAKRNSVEFMQSFKNLASVLTCTVEEDKIEKVRKTVLISDNALAFHNNDINDQVSTIHKAKGKEFDIVFLFSWDFKRFADPDDVNQLYVAITRSKKKLVIFDTQNSAFIRYINNKISLLNGARKNFYYLC
jgi:superfamily I DNA/RNA helicase